MSNKTNYNDKFAKISKNTAFDRLPVAKQEFMKELAFRFKMSQQELRQVVEIERDLAMWGEPGVQTFYQSNATQFSGAANEQKKLFLDKINQHMDALRHAEKVYSIAGSNRPKKREKSQIVQEKSEKKIYGKCPVASPKTVCCNLRTIDAVENCIFGCSYCTIQTFYTDRIIFDEELREKLQNIPIEPNRKYHFGTGQSSDSSRGAIASIISRFSATGLSRIQTSFWNSKRNQTMCSFSSKTKFHQTYFAPGL